MSLPDPATLLEAARHATACAARLRLPLASRVWRGGSGDLAGHGTGASMDFQDHRPYFPGDDPRHINWQAYARTGQYTMKLFREEVRPTIDILLDASPSMFLTPAKSRRTCELFLFAVHCAMRAAATTTIHALPGQAPVPLPIDAVLGNRWPALLPEWPARPSASPAAGPSFDRLPVRPSGLRLLISDLLMPGDPDSTLRALIRDHGSAIIFAPFAPEEATPGWSGPCDLLDIESGQKHDRHVDDARMTRYLAAYAAHFASWKDSAWRHQVPLARVASMPSLESALASEAIAARAIEPAA